MTAPSLTFLGTGTSQGVPMIACDCPVCRSGDPRDKRLRSSALVKWGGLTFVIDPGPDFRTQMLRSAVNHIDAILLTHAHKDHVGGLDDVRSFNYAQKKPVRVCCLETVAESIKRDYSYAFSSPKYPGVPEIDLMMVSPGESFRVYSSDCLDDLCWEGGETGYSRTPSLVEAKDCPFADILPIEFFHDRSGTFPVLGYRFGPLAYVTDIAMFTPEAVGKLRGVEYISVNCVKREKHHSHLSLDEAREFFSLVGARESYLTHISHQLPCFEQLSAELATWEVSGRKGSVHLAYDGLVIGGK